MIGSYQMSLAYDANGGRYRWSETGNPDALYFGEWIEHTAGESRRPIHLPGLDQALLRHLGPPPPWLLLAS